MTHQFRVPHPSICWPELPDFQAARLAAVFDQLMETQWLPAEAFQARQRRQAQALAAFAGAGVRYYRRLFRRRGLFDGTRPFATDWDAIPGLPVADIRDHRMRLAVATPLSGHSVTGTAWLTDASGHRAELPVTGVQQLLAASVMARLVDWYGWDIRIPLAIIGPRDPALPNEERDFDDWGLPDRSGRRAALSGTFDATALNDWLERLCPGYAIVHADAILGVPGTDPAEFDWERAGREIVVLARPSEIQAIRDTVAAAGCDGQWRPALWIPGLGILAAPCPEHGRLHVQGELFLTEITGEDGKALDPGATGRLTVTPLHAMAMPVLRLDTGWRARLTRCDCGRGLPALELIDPGA